MVKPNFFIIGAPKCGTTALSEYLRGHPNVFMSYPKEPYYFDEDFPARSIMRSPDHYMALFQAATSEHLAVGEASAWYLYSSVAVKNIYQFNARAKIIVMLRNPVDLVYSLHSQAVYNFYEDEKDFEVAWRLQAARKNGRRIPKTCREPKFLQYAHVGRLGTQLESVLKIFDPDQVKVILFDDFVTSTRSVYEDVLSFLEVPSDQRTSFPPINENHIYSWFWLSKLIRRPPKHLLIIGRKIKKFFGVDIYILGKVRELNTKKVKRQPLSSEFRRQLIEEFREDIEKLSKLINRDLNNWYIS